MNAFKNLALACSLVLIPLTGFAQTQTTKTEQISTNRFQPITLPYALDALAPVISKQTMELHYGKHLRAYADKLNKLIVGTSYENETDLERIVRTSDKAIYDNAGQLLNHNLYFAQFSPNPTPISEKLLSKIKRQWGSFEKFQQEFERAGAEVFGSGWAWLVEEQDGYLNIVKLSNGGNPVKWNLRPLLGVDVWEHAYYLDYQNRRADHLKALWSIIDWKVVESRLTK